MQKKILKRENGSITLFVLLAILFFLIVIFSLFMKSSNKNVIQSSEIDNIKEEYQESVNNIDQIYDDTLNEHIEDFLKIGDYVNYNYDTVSSAYSLKSSETGYASNQSLAQTQGLNWRILAINDNGTIDLISEEQTNESIYFNDSLGYNNGVLLINNVCKNFYSNNSLGINARNLNLKDIENHLNESGINAIKDYRNNQSQLKYGDSKDGGGNYSYPNLYAKENGSGINTTETKKDGIDVNHNGYTTPTSETSRIANNKLTVTQTYYRFENMLDYFDNNIVYNMLFKDGFSYWLAARFADCGNDTNFGLRVISDIAIAGNGMFNSSGRSGNATANVYYLRPVVSIKTSQIQLCTGDLADGADTTVSHMHQIIPTK